MRPPARHRWALLAAASAAVGCLAPASAGLQPRSITVRAGSDLQRAIDAARAGDTLLLEAGATFVGPFILPSHEGNEYVTIRTSAPDDLLPNATTRVQPGDAPRLARLTTSESGPVVRTRAGAHHWRLLLLEIQGHPEGRTDVLRLGDGADAQRRMADVPHDFVVDRCYVHGDPQGGAKNGIVLQSSATEIRNSYVSGITARGQETHAVIGWNGPGPFLIENNLLEASGINLMFGGGNPGIDGLIPSDIRIQHNHIRKDPAWLGRHDSPAEATPGGSGDGRSGREDARSTRWFVKNLLELKSARRVSIDGNLMEYNWFGHGDQPGYTILLRSENPGRSPWSIVEDVAFTNNIVRHAPGGISIIGVDSGRPAKPAHDIRIVNNLWADIDPAEWSTGRRRSNARFASISGADRVTFDRNTVVNTGSFLHAAGTPSKEFVFTRNAGVHGKYGVKGDSKAVGRATLDAYFPGAVFRDNVLAGGRPKRYPPGNRFPTLEEYRRAFVQIGSGGDGPAADGGHVGAGRDGAAGADVGMLCDRPCATGRAGAERP